MSTGPLIFKGVLDKIRIKTRDLKAGNEMKNHDSLANEVENEGLKVTKEFFHDRI